MTEDPRTIPGSWSGQDSPALGDSYQDISVSQAVPRSQGVVSENGDVLDDTGKTIGKIAGSKDPKELVGNTVTAAGDVVNSSGEIVGESLLDSDSGDYTTTKAQDAKPETEKLEAEKSEVDKPELEKSEVEKPEAEQAEVEQPEAKKKGGFGLGGVTNTVSGLVKPISSGLGFSKRNDQSDATIEKAQTKSETQFEGTEAHESPAVQLEDKDDSPLDIQQAKKDAEDKLPSKDVADDVKEPEAAQDVQKDVDQAKDDLKEVPPQPEAEPEAAKDAAKEAVPVDDKTEDAPAVEDVKDDVKDTVKGEAPAGDEAKTDIPSTEEVKEGVPLGDEAKTDIPSTEEVKEGVSLGDEAKTDVPATEDVKETGEEVEKDLPSTEDAKTEVPATEDVQEDAKEGVEDVEEDAKEGLDDAKEGVDETKEGIDEAKEGVDETIPAGDEAKDAAAEAKEEKAEDAGEEGPVIDYSILKGTKVNKAGNLVNKNGDVIGRIIEGDPKRLLGKRADENGIIWDDAGKIAGKAEPLPDNERENLKENAPFENFPNSVVEADGRVMCDGQQVGIVVEGDAKRLKGSKVDEDGDILDRRGNVVGKAQAWDEPEAEPEAVVDQSVLAGKRVNKAGNVVDTNGVIYGRVIEGNVSTMIGRMCDKEGNVRSEAGDIIGKAKIVTEGEREGSKEGPFAEMSGLTVAKNGTIVTPAGDVVGRLVSGDPKVLFGRSVDEDGDVVDRNGNVLAKAERWEEPEVEKKKDPLAGRRVDREGNVRDDNHNIIGKLISGEIGICSGKEVDDDGDVVNSKGQTIGHVTRLEDLPPEPEPEPEVEEESVEAREAREQAEKDKKLAGDLASVVEQSLDRVRPICKRITELVEKAERTPKEELDEEDLVKHVKPLIEEGGKILTETNGAIRGMDPDGRIQRNAKHKSATREATPEEFHLADVLKELTGTVSECIDNAKRKIDDMPHAKKELNPLWGLLAEPLFQILAAVGLLLNGVLGLVGRLLNIVGLGGLVDNLLGGLGVNRILESLGLGSVIGALTGKDQKKKK